MVKTKGNEKPWNQRKPMHFRWRNKDSDDCRCLNLSHEGKNSAQGLPNWILCTVKKKPQIKTFSAKQKIKAFIISRHALEETVNEVLHI